MHSIHFKYAPRTLEHMCTSNSERSISQNLRNRNEYFVPRSNFSFFNRFPLYTLPQTWNNAGIVTFYNNTTTFKIALLNELLENPESTSLNQPLPLPLPHTLPLPLPLPHTLPLPLPHTLPLMPLPKNSHNWKGQNTAKIKIPCNFSLLYSIPTIIIIITIFSNKTEV